MKKLFYSIVTGLLLTGLASCSDVPSPYDVYTPDTQESDSIKTLPYLESLTSSAGDFSIVNVQMSDDLSFVWTFSSSYSCMKASAYVNGTNYATESWFISPPIDLSSDTAAYLNFEHSTGYVRSGNPSDFMKVMVSKDYTAGDPAAAAWTELPVPNWYTGTAFEFVASGDLNLSGFTGESNIHVAFKYISTASVAPTWEVKSFSLTATAEQGGGDTPAPPADGEGSKSQPYTVSQAQENQGSTAWVQGYIVGYIDGMTFASGAVFGLPTEAQTEILIADDASCTDHSACLPVQLPTGAIRTALELYAHPDLLGQSVLLYGSLEKYFGAAGMKTTSCAIVDDAIYGTDPTAGGEGGGGDADALYSENFSGGQGAWTTAVLKGAEDWGFTSHGTDYYAKISAYNTTGTQEAWLVSPEIELTRNASLTFDVCVAYWTADYLEVYATNEYESDISAAAWERLDFTLPQTPVDGFGSFVPAGTASLANFTGSKVRIAFRYDGEGTAGKTTTYEVTRIVIK